MELNVQESCINLFANPVVQKKQARHSTPKIHGLVYDVATGLLKKLDIDFKVCERAFVNAYGYACACASACVYLVTLPSSLNGIHHSRHYGGRDVSIDNKECNLKCSSCYLEKVRSWK